jgi:hypothetical protein
LDGLALERQNPQSNNDGGTISFVTAVYVKLAKQLEIPETWAP